MEQKVCILLYQKARECLAPNKRPKGVLRAIFKKAERFYTVKYLRTLEMPPSYCQILSASLEESSRF